MTSSNGNIFRVIGPLCGEVTGPGEFPAAPVNSPHKGQWRGALMFSLSWAWINDWVNNREASDLRRHRGHYDVNVTQMHLTTICFEVTCFCRSKMLLFNTRFHLLLLNVLSKFLSVIPVYEGTPQPKGEYVAYALPDFTWLRSYLCDFRKSCAKWQRKRDFGLDFSIDISLSYANEHSNKCIELGQVCPCIIIINNWGKGAWINSYRK